MEEAQTESTPQSRKRPGGRSALVRKAVLEASLSLVAERGPDGYSMAELAKRSGVHETTIYRRWSSREAALLEALLEQVEDAIPLPPGKDFRSTLVAMLESAIEFYRSPTGALLLRAMAADGPGMSELKRRFWARRLEGLSGLLDPAPAMGGLQPGRDPRELLYAAMGSLFMRNFMLGETLEPRMAAEVVAAVLGP